jgi:ankyrin repeat protein
MKRPIAVPIIVALLLVAAVLLIYAFKGLGGGAPVTPGPTAGDTRTNTPIRSSKFPLHEAARAGDAQSITRLLAEGASVNAKLPAGGLTGVSRVGATPVMLAADSGSVEAVRALIAAQADVDAAAEDGWTALMVAASSRVAPPAALEAIIAAGAGIDAKNAEGRTALMVAASSRQGAKVYSLLNAGASVDVTDARGATALSLASDSSSPNGASDPTALKALLEAGANPNAADAAGLTPLMRAAARDDLDAVIVLLDHGALVDGKSAAGKTALDYARALSGTRKVACLTVLADAGAN